MSIDTLLDAVLPGSNRVVYDDSRETSRRLYSPAFYALGKRCSERAGARQGLHDRLRSTRQGETLGQARARRCYEGVEFLSGENRLYAHRGDFLHQNWNTAFRTVEETVWLLAWITGNLPASPSLLEQWLIALGSRFASVSESLLRIAAAETFPHRAGEALAAAAAVTVAIRGFESSSGTFPLGTSASASTLDLFLNDPARLSRHRRTNVATEWRGATDLLVTAYRELPQIRSFAVGSSLATGWADEYSDVDLLAFCEELPPLDDRRRVLEPLLDPKSERSQSAQIDNFAVRGLSGHIIFVPLRQQRAILTTKPSAVAPDADKGLLLLRHDLLNCEAVAGDPEVVHELRAMAACYPRALQQQNVTRELSFIEQCEGEMQRAADAGVPVTFFTACAFAGISVAYLLCALNARHCDDVGLKWGDRILRTVERKPVECAERVEAISLGLEKRRLRARLAEFRKLVRELRGLAESLRLSSAE